MSPWHDIKQFMAARPKGTRENINWKKSQFARNNLKRFICWSSCWHFCSLFTGRGSVITCSWRQGLISILPQYWSWSNVHFENIIDLIRTYWVAVYWCSWRQGPSQYYQPQSQVFLSCLKAKRKLDPIILSCRRLLMVVLFQSKNKSEHIELSSTAGPCSSAAYSTSILTRCTETKLQTASWILKHMFGSVKDYQDTYLWKGRSWLRRSRSKCKWSMECSGGEGRISSSWMTIITQL